MKYEAVVFDLDGTLTDSAPGIMRCLDYSFEKMGIPAPEEKLLRRFLGPPLVKSFMEYCGMTEKDAICATQAYRERYHIKGCRENRVYPGIRNLLAALRAARIRLSVATGKPADASEKILKAFFLAPYFEVLAGPGNNDHFAEKKDLIIRSLDGFSGKSVMVGDRASDILAARELGMDSVAVLWGYGSREELEAANPTYLVSTAEELCTVVGVNPVKKAGYFISLEGNDGCGKSTQVELLYSALQSLGLDVIKTREPGGSFVAEKIRSILLDRSNIGMQDMTEALLYAAARAQHVRDVIEPALEAGKVVLSDRYVDSSIAYQGAGRQLGMELVAGINAPAIGTCIPNLTVLLDIDAKEALRRRERAGETDRIEMLEDSFHLRVGEAYRKLLKDNPERIKRVDASGTPEEVADRVLQLVCFGLSEAGLL